MNKLGMPFPRSSGLLCVFRGRIWFLKALGQSCSAKRCFSVSRSRARSGQLEARRQEKKRVRSQKAERCQNPGTDIPWDRACHSFFPGHCSSLCFVACPGDPSLDQSRRKILLEGKSKPITCSGLTLQTGVGIKVFFSIGCIK